jgi:ABC-type nitrate/sulfonate/bicarbonate transport system ATPase subunit
VKVELRSVSFRYPGSDPVLADLDLTVADGSVHAIVGPNGCGKTTLLRLVARLEQPTQGSIEFVGTRRHANLTAMVFQDPRLIPWWTVGRNVGIGPEFAEVERGMLAHIRDFYSSLFGLGGLAERLPNMLSRGQQSRAGLGRAFAHEAEVLLMDEPFTHIDIPSRRRILGQLEATWIKSPRTTIFVTHDIEEAVLIGDRVSVMSRHPGPIVDTIEVDAERPRFDLPATHPGLRSAVSRTWDALEGLT